MKTMGSLKSIMGVPEKGDTFENLAKYKEFLATLNKARLQDLCMEQGLIPSHERRMMVRGLEKKFQRNQAKGVRVLDQGSQGRLKDITSK